METYKSKRCAIKSSFGHMVFSVQVKLQQESVLRPYLFDIVVNVMAHDIKCAALSNMMFVEDVVIFESAREIRNRVRKVGTAIREQGIKSK